MLKESGPPGRARAVLRGLAAALAAGVVVAGCGSGGGGTGPEAASPASGAFPVTISHAFGETTVPAEPVRVVTVGNTDQDAVLALGVVPVGTTEWYGKQPGAIHPWATQALGDAPLPEVLSITDGIQFERIAALQPDLILGLYAGLEQADYDRLSQIAPTVTQPPGVPNYKITWQEQARVTGEALGRSDRAAELVAEVEQRFTDARAQHPEFAGRTAVSAQFSQGTFKAWSSGDARGNLLTQLGFTVPAEIDQIAGDQAIAAISAERLDLLDVDALVLGVADPTAAQADLAANPLYSSLAVHQQGREVFYTFGDTEHAPSAYFTVLSMPLVLDRIVPELAAASDGDPNTPVPTPPVLTRS